MIYLYARTNIKRAKADRVLPWGRHCEFDFQTS